MDAFRLTMLAALAVACPLVEVVVRSGILAKVGDGGRAEQMNRLSQIAGAAGFDGLAARYQSLAARYIQKSRVRPPGINGE